MSIKICQYTDEHKCIKCYNLGGSNEHQQIQTIRTY